MKNAVISTLGRVCLFANYGTFWQHYALRTTISRMGFQVSRYSTLERGYSGMDWLVEWLKNCIRIPLWRFRRFEGYEFQCANLFPVTKIKRKFAHDYLKFIGKFNEENHINEETVLVVGSDQVLYDKPRPWFGLIQKSGRRIIYAGSTDWVYQGNNEAWTCVARKELPKFSAVSVRERAGIALCAPFVARGKTVQKVVDPVLLLQAKEWKTLAKQSCLFKQPTLFCYFVNIVARSQLHVELLEELAHRLNCDLRILGIQGTAGWIPKKYLIALSPTEFLAGMRDSKYVITNSFHGSVFALLFNKQFICTYQECIVGTDQNLRQRELMESLDLKRFHVSDSCLEDMLQLFSQKIDYASVFAKIASWREFSLRWLSAALS